ncbi:MAG: hypothetical protein EHM72_03325, partial [Calditrichaeota bacterium]
MKTRVVYMEAIDQKEIVENISFLVAEKDVPALKNLIVDTHPADMAAILQELNEDECIYLFHLIDPEYTPDVLSELDEVTREDIVSRLATSHLTEIVEEMDSDDAADII